MLYVYPVVLIILYYQFALLFVPNHYSLQKKQKHLFRTQLGVYTTYDQVDFVLDKALAVRSHVCRDTTRYSTHTGVLNYILSGSREDKLSMIHYITYTPVLSY